MNKRKLVLYGAIFALMWVIFAGIMLLITRGFSSKISRTFFAADTVCTITLYDGDEKTLDGAVELCNSLANKFNCRDDSSELGKLNKSKSSDNPSAELLEVINYGVWYSSLSNGIFDISVKPLSTLWDFKNQIVPKSDDAHTAASLVNYKNIKISNNTISLKNKAEIDLGAIAKGYIADKVSDFLTKNDVKSGIINLGGNITVIGKKDDGNFNIGIQKPFDDNNAALISCNNTSVVTSGIYQRYFEKDDKIYHHILDTTTGYPVRNELYSVTIISDSATRADALSTLCFLLGIEKSMELLKDFDDTEAVFIDSNQKLHLTSGLKQSGNLIEFKQ